MHKHFYILLIFVVFSHCKLKPENAKSDAVKETWDVDKSEFERGAALNPEEWNCFKIGNDDLCCPSVWKPIKQKEYYYLSNLENPKENTSFLILRYPVSTTGITPTLYLKETYRQALKDTVDEFTGYTVKKLVFQDRETYYSELFGERSRKKYTTFSMMFEKDNYLYDFCLKVEKDKSGQYQEIFKNILFNFKVKGEQVFDEHDKIEKIEVLDLSKL